MSGGVERRLVGTTTCPALPLWRTRALRPERHALARRVLWASEMSAEKLRTRNQIALLMVLSPVILMWLPLLGEVGASVWAASVAVLVPTGALLAAVVLVQAVRQRVAMRRGDLAAPLLVVLAYLGLVGLIRWTLWNNWDEARPDTARVQASDIAKAAQLYRVKTGRFPSALEELTTHAAPAKRPIMERIPPDPWERPYRYRVTDGSISICSDGEDGHASTDDDLCVASSSTSAGRLQEVRRR